MRFEVTRALDAIERRLRTDPLLTGAVVDLAEAIRLPGLDNARPANLLRLGLVIDGLSQQLADESVALYGVAERGLLSDTDLTSNERMVLRRWSDDGLIEIIPAGVRVVGRVCEVARALGQPLITTKPPLGFGGARLMPVPAPGGLALAPSGAATTAPHATPSRLWRCPVPDCPSFGPHRPGSAQSPPGIAGGGIPVCPRHGERLTDAGPRPASVVLALRANGLARHRFVLTAGTPLTVGRAPEAPGSVVLAPYLEERAALRISRSHLRFELADRRVMVTDLSTNGSLLRVYQDPSAPPRVETLTRGQPRQLGEWDAIEIAEGVEVGRADRRTGEASDVRPSSVMRDAPTIAMRLPPMR